MYDPDYDGGGATGENTSGASSGYQDPVFVGYAEDGTAVYEQQGQLIHGGSGNWQPWFGDRSTLTPGKDRVGTPPPKQGDPAPPAPPAPTPTPTVGGPMPAMPASIYSLPAMPTFNAPTFNKPPAFTYDKFVAPTVEEAMNEPGFQFRTKQGTDALQNWAAARGTLNDSSTAKALEDYGQQAASSEYQNVWGRKYNAWTGDVNAALDAYRTNYGTQYSDPYAAEYRSYLDTVVNPAMQAYQTQAAWNQHANDLSNSNFWNWTYFDEDRYRDRRNTLLDFAGR